MANAAYQITTKHARNAMAKALAGDAPLPRATAIAFGNGGHNPDALQNGKAIPIDQSTLNNEVAVIPIQSHTYPGDGVARFSVFLNPDAIPGGFYSETALIDENGNALAIQTFGFTSVSPNGGHYYDWEEIF